MKKKLFQPFHLVDLSPWPILMSFMIFNMMICLVNWFNMMKFNLLMLFLMILMNLWWRDIIRESLNQGFHCIKVVNGLKLGMILFIISEIFFFISIFWCYFHMFLSPSIEIGSIWPPKNILMFNPYSIPLLNTMILLSSGISLTWSHFSLIKNNKFNSLMGLMLTIILGMIFSMFQILEYFDASFTFSDSIFGSIFFMSTGFHGFHVFLGTLFLLINFIRMLKNNYSWNHHFGFEAAIWYWHFVDVVWLFLYFLLYFWSFN